MRRLSCCFLAASLLSLGVDASADEPPWPRAQQSRAGMEIDVFPVDAPFIGSFVDVTSLGFVPFGQIGVHDNVFIDVELPIAAYVADSNLPDGAALGSISVGAHYAADPEDLGEVELAWYAGGNIGIPTMLASDPEAEPALAGLLALPHHALVDTHRYTIEFLPLRVGGGLELRALDELLYFRASLAPVLWIPLDGADTEFILEQVNELEFRAPFGLGGGIRFQEAFTFTFDDKIQLAVEPFIGFEPKKLPVIARFGLMMPLDNTLGPAFENGRVRTIRMMVGAKW